MSTQTVLKLSEVERREVSWLWQGRVPFGKLTLLEGDPGVGKSTVVGDLVARVTTGRPMPIEDESGTGTAKTVLMIAAEDDPAETIRPRIEAMGGNPDRVLVVSEAAICLPSGADYIRELVETNDVALVVIDPITAHLDTGIDPNKDTDVRRALQPLADLAAATGAAVILVRHLRKEKGRALHSGAGSMAFVAIARSVMLAADDPSTGTGLPPVSRTHGYAASRSLCA